PASASSRRAKRAIASTSCSAGCCTSVRRVAARKRCCGPATSSARWRLRCTFRAPPRCARSLPPPSRAATRPRSTRTSGRCSPMTERVLLHAGIADWRMYRQQLETLAPARAFDLPGFGETPVGQNTPDDRTFVRDNLPDLPATLIGTSHGGRLALELALESPERVAALVLVGPGLAGHEWSEEVRAFGAEEEAALERGDLDGAVEANVSLWLAAGVDPEGRPRGADLLGRAFDVSQRHAVP